MYEIDCKKVTKGPDNVGECPLQTIPLSLFGAYPNEVDISIGADANGAAQISEPTLQLKRQMRPWTTHPSRSSTLSTPSA